MPLFAVNRFRAIASKGNLGDAEGKKMRRKTITTAIDGRWTRLGKQTELNAVRRRGKEMAADAGAGASPSTPRLTSVPTIAGF